MVRVNSDPSRRDVLKLAGGSLAAVATSGVASASTLDVATKDASSIDDSSAYLNGELLDLGGASSADVWFEWGESGSDLPYSTSSETMSSTGIFSHQITGLSSGTTYEFKAVAYTDLDGRVEGSRLSFTTSSGGGGGGGGDDGECCAN